MSAVAQLVSGALRAARGPESRRRIVRALIALRRKRARLQLAHTKALGFSIPYLHGGPRLGGDDVVLVHGFSDNKDSFVDTARGLVATHRVVIPDLPGFGDASQPMQFRYTPDAMVEVLSAALDALRLERFHLVGSSMGGALASLYALANPERVRTLSLIGAAGVTMPELSWLQKRVDAGDNPFVMSSHDEWEGFMAELFERPPAIPGIARRLMAEDFLARAALNTKIFADLTSGEVDLTPRLSEIAAPTLVLWGDCDRFVDLSAGRVYHAGIPNARLRILHRVGHMPHVESPGRTAHLLRAHFAGQ